MSVENGRVERLDQVIEALPARAVESKVTISPENWENLIHRLCNPGGMSGYKYGTDYRDKAKCETKNGKGTRAYFVVWIIRTDAGMYEFGCNT